MPVATSSLMQVPMIQPLLPSSKRVGVITISKSTLTDEHLKAANVPLDTPIIGTESGREFTSGLLDSHSEIDFQACRLNMIDAGREMV